jgi:hypothetical protein
VALKIKDTATMTVFMLFLMKPLRVGQIKRFVALALTRVLLLWAKNLFVAAIDGWSSPGRCGGPVLRTSRSKPVARPGTQNKKGPRHLRRGLTSSTVQMLSNV